MFRIIGIEREEVTFKDQPCILVTQAKQVFYLEDLARRPIHWKVVQDVNLKKGLNGDVIIVEDDNDVIHDNNSSDLALSANLNELDFATLNIDGQSTEVEVPPPTIHVDDDEDFIDDEDDVPYNLIAAAVARGHVSDGAGDLPPHPRQIGSVCQGSGSRKGRGIGGRDEGRRFHSFELVYGCRRMPEFNTTAPQWGELLSQVGSWGEDRLGNRSGGWSVEDDNDVIHDNNSSNLTLSTNLNDFDFATLNIDGQSTKVEAPPPTIHVDDDDDFIDDEDDVLYDLVDSNIEVLSKLMIMMKLRLIAAAVVCSHVSDGASDPPPYPRQIGSICQGSGSQRGRGIGGRDGGRRGVCKATKNKELKKTMENFGLWEIDFDWNDQGDRFSSYSADIILGEDGLGSGSGRESGEVEIGEGGSGKGGSDSGDDEGKIIGIGREEVTFEVQPYILATQAKQVFYLEDPARRPIHWKVVQDMNLKKCLNGDVIIVEDDNGVIHDNNSGDLALCANLNDLDFSTLNINGQSTKVEAPSPTIHVDDDDFIDDEDDVPYDLIAATIVRGHVGNGASDPPPHPHQISSVCRGSGSRRGRGIGGRDGGGDPDVDTIRRESPSNVEQSDEEAQIMTAPQWGELLSQVGSWGEDRLGNRSGGWSGKVRIGEDGSGKGGSDSGDDEGK
ncbi:hypothetical protein Tco_0241542 [Tanacetum coccineum]